MTRYLENISSEGFEKQADVKILIVDKLYTSLPRPPFTDQETDASAERLYDFVWQQTESGVFKAAS